MSAKALFTSLAVIAGAGAVVGAAYYNVVKGVENRNADEYTQSLAAIDAGVSAVFRTKADCEARGYASNDCDDMFNHALARATAPGTTIAYSSVTDCQQVYERCASVPNDKGRHSYYTPNINGIQVSVNRHTNAVALFASAGEPDQAVRWDGNRVSLRADLIYPAPKP